MPRGAPAKPIVDKIARGNPGKGRLNPIVPVPKSGPMLCPMAVAENEIAKAYWDLYLNNAAPGHIAPIDGPLLARLCMALARCDAAEAKMGTNLLILYRPVNARKDDKSQARISPLLQIVNEQTNIARQLASELAIPPAQRNRIGIAYGASTEEGFHITIGAADADL